MCLDGSVYRPGVVERRLRGELRQKKGPDAAVSLELCQELAFGRAARLVREGDDDVHLPIARTLEKPDTHGSSSSRRPVEGTTTLRRAVGTGPGNAPAGAFGWAPRNLGDPFAQGVPRRRGGRHRSHMALPGSRPPNPRRRASGKAREVCADALRWDVLGDSKRKIPVLAPSNSLRKPPRRRTSSVRMTEKWLMQFRHSSIPDSNPA